MNEQAKALYWKLRNSKENITSTAFEWIELPDDIRLELIALGNKMSEISRRIEEID